MLLDNHRSGPILTDYINMVNDYNVLKLRNDDDGLAAFSGLISDTNATL